MYSQQFNLDGSFGNNDEVVLQKKFCEKFGKRLFVRNAELINNEPIVMGLYYDSINKSFTKIIMPNLYEMQSLIEKSLEDGVDYLTDNIHMRVHYKEKDWTQFEDVVASLIRSGEY